MLFFFHLNLLSLIRATLSFLFLSPCFFPFSLYFSTWWTRLDNHLLFSPFLLLLSCQLSFHIFYYSSSFLFPSLLVMSSLLSFPPRILHALFTSLSFFFSMPPLLFPSFPCMSSLLIYLFLLPLLSCMLFLPLPSPINAPFSSLNFSIHKLHWFSFFLLLPFHALLVSFLSSVYAHFPSLSLYIYHTHGTALSQHK